MRIVFAMGPGDSVTSFSQWLQGNSKGGETAKNYTALTLDFVAAEGVQAWLISSNDRVALVEHGPIRVENRPKPLAGAGGLAYHWQQWRYFLSLARSVRQFNATHVVIDSGTTHWFFLSLLALRGVKAYASFHNTYYPIGHWRSTVIRDAIRRLDGLFFRHLCAGALGVSQECRSQYAEVGGRAADCLLYNAVFDPADFERFTSKPLAGLERRIVYVGRIEDDKGVFDLVHACRKLVARQPHLTWRVDFCGQGNAMAALGAMIDATPELREHMHLRGQLDRSSLLQAYELADVVVVPTTSRFSEGFPKVCAEALLARRPLLISSAVPTVEGLELAACTYRCDDPDALAEQLETLLTQPQFHAAKAAACSHISAHFLDPARGLTQAFKRLIRS